MKIVIQSHIDYEAQLQKLLSSMKIHTYKNVIIVYANEAYTQIYREVNGLTVIKMKENIWEYTSILALQRYMNNQYVMDTCFFLLHDTCFIKDNTIFWNGLVKMEEAHLNTYDFVYPSQHAKKNIGLASNDCIMTFGNHLETIPLDTFDKKKGISLESFIPKTFKYICMPHYKYIGKRKIDNKIRNLHFFPYISLFKHNGVDNKSTQPLNTYIQQNGKLRNHSSYIQTILMMVSSILGLLTALCWMRR